MVKSVFCALFISLVLSAAGISHGLVHFDFEQPYFSEPGLVVKDHSLIRVGSIYHLFYLRGNPAVNIGHAISTDLIHWNLELPVLYVEPGTWDERALWAPDVMAAPSGGYYMYYTGVNNDWSQQTGLAVSPDLYFWIKYPFPIYHPDPSWAAWTDSTWSNGRDPFVFEHDGTKYMLSTAHTIYYKGAIASATSNDYSTWEDNGPIYIHDSWHVLESVQCIYRNSKFHLFFTEQVIGGTSHMASNSLYSGWDISTRTIIDLGQAPEVDLFDSSHLFSRHGVYYHPDDSRTYIIRFDQLSWLGDKPVVRPQWPLNKNWNSIEGTAFYYQPTFYNNLLARGDSVDVGFEGDSWIGTHERFQGPLTGGTEGDFQGDTPTGLIRSNPFIITGNSMNLLVGGGNYPDSCYVALVDFETGEFLFKETGENSDVMSRRYWNLVPHKGKNVYIEIADNSTVPFGHINVDDITESMAYINLPEPNPGTGKGKKDPSTSEGIDEKITAIVLYQNSPNPFNPSTTISYYLPFEAHTTLDVYNVNGALVLSLVNARESEGRHQVVWDGRNSNGAFVSAGIYFYRLSVGGKIIDTKKMLLLK